MTSAKLQSMAAQTDAPDDLIAELARLMADDARATPANEPSPPVRIPGQPAIAPVPRFDFSASSSLASEKAPASPVRIPGGDPAPKVEGAEPFSFNFDFGSAAPKPTPVPATAPALSVETTSPRVVAPKVGLPASPLRDPEPAVDAEEPQMLDQDSLADLIAAELAADMGGDRSSTPEQHSAEPDAPEPDSFGVPPVFGLGSSGPADAPAPVAQPVASAPAPVVSAPREQSAASPEPTVRPSRDVPDPLEEIEQLVGPAVRLNLGNAAPAPSLRRLATPEPVEPVIAPVEPPTVQPAPRASQPAAEISSVDDAILAAAAATGAHVEWVNAGPGDDAVAAEAEPTVAPAPRARVRMNRAVAGPLVAIALLAVAGFGLYWVLGQGGATTGPAPLLVADTTPAKEVPANDATEPAPQSVVFNEISGANSPGDEQIVSRDQADTDAVVAANSPVSTSGTLGDVSGTTVDPNQDGLVNRKVRTVTVRPDGTIVSGDDSLAGSAMLPVDRPNVPDVPGADFSTPDLIASATAEAETAAAAAVTAEPATPQVTGPVAEPGASVAVVDAAGAPIAGRTVTIPMQRPSDFSTMAAAAIASANTTPAAAPAATTPVASATAPQATAAPVTNAAAYVQMASQRSEAEAQATVQAITTRYGVLFGGASPQIQRADLGERGVYYRVLVPAASREAAANICTNVKAAGGDCLLL